MTLESFLLRANGRCKHCLFHVESQGCRCGGSEWSIFVAALRQCVRADGTISQNDVRPLVAGKISGPRVARFYQIAQAQGDRRLIQQTGTYDDSTDVRGKNHHKACARYEWLGSAAA